MMFRIAENHPQMAQQLSYCQAIYQSVYLGHAGIYDMICCVLLLHIIEYIWNLRRDIAGSKWDVYLFRGLGICKKMPTGSSSVRSFIDIKCDHPWKLTTWTSKHVNCQRERERELGNYVSEQFWGFHVSLPGSFCTLWLTLKWTCFALKHCPPAISFTWQWKITHI